MTTETTTPDYSARYEPPSLRWILDSGGNPLDAMRPWAGRGGVGPDEEGYDNQAIHLAEDMHRLEAWARNGDSSEHHRRSVEWMIEHQDDGLTKTAFGDGVTPRKVPPGAFQRVALGEMWAAEVLEDPSLAQRAVDAAGPECRFLYDAITWEMAIPNPDGLDLWDDLTVDERIQVEKFAEGLIASRGN